MRNILLVEDEEDLALAMAFHLRQNGFSVSVVGDGDRAKEVLSVQDFDLVILDVRLVSPLGDGLARILVVAVHAELHACRWCVVRSPSAPLVVVVVPVLDCWVNRTASTMRCPTTAMAAGRRPARTVSRAMTISRRRSVSQTSRTARAVLEKKVR